MIDQASVFADRFKGNPQVLQATVLGQGTIPGLDPYTALNALKLIKESQMARMAGMAQQPTSAPSIVAETLAPTPMQQGLGAMVPGAMGGQSMPPQGIPPQGMPPQGIPPQGMPQQRAPMPQPTMQAASGGLAGMYTPEEDFAEGGIIAFQDRGLVPAVSDDPTRRISRDDGETDSGAEVGFPMFTSTGDPKTYATLAEQLPGAIQGISDYKATGMTPEQYKKIQMDEIAAYREAMGPNTAMESLASDIAERKKERAGNLEEGKGVALLKAAYAVTQGNNWARAFAGAGAAFGDEYNRALQADKLEKRSIAVAEFNMADAQRKENLGLFKEGRAAADRATTAQQTADKARLEKAKAYADAVTKGMNATKPLRSAFGGAGGPKPPKLAERLYDDNLANLMETETPQEGESTKAFQARIRAKAGELTARQVKDFGPTKAGSEEAKLTETTESNLDKDVNKQAIFDPAYQKAMSAGDSQGMSDAKLAIRRRIIANRQATSGKPSDGGVNKNSTTAPDISTIKGAPAGSTIGKSTAKGWEVLDPSGTVIGYAQK